jgi:plasmid stabilization system protein ParE
VTLAVALTPEAQADIEEVHAWYAARAAGLAEEFRGALDQGLEGVATFPEAYPLIYRSVRRALLRRFPYCVFYVVERERVVVYGCFHARRDPSIWQLRTGAG